MVALCHTAHAGLWQLPKRTLCQQHPGPEIRRRSDFPQRQPAAPGLCLAKIPLQGQSQQKMAGLLCFTHFLKVYAVNFTEKSGNFDSIRTVLQKRVEK